LLIGGNKVVNGVFVLALVDERRIKLLFTPPRVQQPAADRVDDFVQFFELQETAADVECHGG
jgi:hypothetical protein